MAAEESRLLRRPQWVLYILGVGFYSGQYGYGVLKGAVEPAIVLVMLVEVAAGLERLGVNFSSPSRQQTHLLLPRAEAMEEAESSPLPYNPLVALH